MNQTGIEEPIQDHIIQPVPFKIPKGKGFKRPSRRRWVWILPLVILGLALAGVAWFVFTATPVIIKIEPQPHDVSLQGGFITPRFGDHFLLRPGVYRLEAKRPGYYPLEKEIYGGAGEVNRYQFSMEKLPGLITLRVHQDKEPDIYIPGARIVLEGQDLGLSPLKEIEIKPGNRDIEIRAERYMDLHETIHVEGEGKRQAFDFGLKPAWADITIQSVPEGGSVWVDKKEEGKTPLTLGLLEGRHELEIRAPGHKTWWMQLSVEAGRPQLVGPVKLLPADGRLAIQTNPSGSSVVVTGHYAGQTPLEIVVPSEKALKIQISKAGYESVSRTVTVSPEQTKALSLRLVPKKGRLLFFVEPRDAEFILNGRSLGKVPAKIDLVAVKHVIEIRKPGYKPYKREILPRPKVAQEVRVSLKKKIEKRASPSPPKVYKAANGYTLTHIKPDSFTMGASRREQGRRSNETLREIKLQRPFYMGVREVTNGEFRAFLRGHNSGSYKGRDLNQKDLPVVQVTWEQAALFCNWLSAKESLPPAYTRKEDRMVAVEPMTPGYRLPTEAEWEYCARYQGKGTPLKYPWGERYPPKNPVVNIGDLSAKTILSSFIENYDDGFETAAPPMQYKANRLGIYDMGGNVAEWCHDYYSIYPYKPGLVYVDPMGPREGAHRVVRGSSWRDASISSLRLSYRGYSQASRQDLGFRICRYTTQVR